MKRRASERPLNDVDVLAASRVLVVDDNPANLALMNRLLRSLGVGHVTTLNDPTVAVERCEDIDASLVVVDLHMPDMSGLALLTQLRDHLAPEAHLPIIMITADITPEARREALDAGADDFLTKPFDVVEVELRIRNHLRAAALHRNLRHQRDGFERRVAERTAQLETANDELLALDRMKRDFVSLVSHEMRTPLTAIKGFSQLLGSKWDQLTDAQRAQQVDAIERNSARLQQLVDNLLAAATLETGQAPGTAAPGDDREQPIALLLDTIVAESGLERDDVVIGASIGSDVHADREVIRTVVTNLLSNARRYGALPIHLDVTLADGHVEIAVRDHGAGLPPDFVDRAFEQFSQASVGDRRTASGAGLGLWIARNMAEKSGGRLDYETGDPGARFVLRLPALKPS